MNRLGASPTSNTPFPGGMKSMMARVWARVCWCDARLITSTWPPPALAIAAASAFSLTNISMAPEPPKMYATGPFGGFLRSCASVYETWTKSSLGMRM